MEFKSTQKFIIVSPKKLQEVAKLASKLEPQDAVVKLPFTNKKAARVLVKVIKTALANAKQKGVEGQNLLFSEIQINEGPRLKRYRAGARGRAKPYKRRMSHVRVVLKTKEKEQIKKEVKRSKNEKVETKRLKSKENKKVKNAKAKKVDRKKKKGGSKS